MTGAVLTLLGGKTAASGSGGPSAMSWANISARGIGANAAQTFAGFTGTINISASVTGGALLAYYKNGVNHGLYTGPFAVNPGDTVAWMVQIPGSSGVSGTVTVDYNGTNLIDSFNYVLTWP